jgi:hypothetical protein
VLVSLVRVSIPPMTYSSHELISSTCEPTNCFEEVQCDTLVKECDGWVIVPFYKIVVYSNIVIYFDLQMVGQFEL